MKHNKKDGHVMLMAPNNGGSGGLPGSKTPSGMAHPAVKVPPSGGNGDGGDGGEPPKDDPEERVEEAIEKPIPVVFTQSTFIKLIAWTLGPLLIVISAALFFYHKAMVHMDDPNIHLGKAERTKLETKEEAKKERKKLRSAIKTHVDVKVREIKVEQRELLDKAKTDLKKQQTLHYNRILTEIRKNR